MDNENENYNYNGNQIDKLIKLGQAERKMKQVMSPIPSRPTLITYIKKGILNGKKIGNSFYLFESSLEKFIKESKRKL